MCLPSEAPLWIGQLCEKGEEAKQAVEQAEFERAALLPSMLNVIFTGEGDD